MNHFQYLMKLWIIICNETHGAIFVLYFPSLSRRVFFAMECKQKIDMGSIWRNSVPTSQKLTFWLINKEMLIIRISIVIMNIVKTHKFCFRVNN